VDEVCIEVVGLEGREGCHELRQDRVFAVVTFVAPDLKMGKGGIYAQKLYNAVGRNCGRDLGHEKQVLSWDASKVRFLNTRLLPGHTGRLPGYTGRLPRHTPWTRGTGPRVGRQTPSEPRVVPGNAFCGKKFTTRMLYYY